ncbi:MAG: undecaprenyl-diphosphate phosphatase [Myxococcota bacterium]
MSLLDVVILGIIEGLTELLPVSSTGHLILVGEALGGHDTEAAKSLDVVIQLGAVVAVAVYFRARLRITLRGLRTRDPDAVRLVAALLAAFVPTAVVGLAIHGWVKQHLFAPVPVALALIVGGAVMIIVEAWHRRRPPTARQEGLSAVTPFRGLCIGVAQCFSLWPGASRSMTTIVGGQLTGLDTKTAAEFSFLLALPTLGAATVYDFAKNGHAILAAPSGAAVLATGLSVSFAVTWLVVAVFLRYVKRVGLTPFGVYRIALGTVVLLMAARV